MNLKKKVVPLLLTGALWMQIVPVYALTKEETVYTKLKTDGSSYKTIVNEHLINQEKNDKIEDVSTLQNVKNINGSEKVTNKNGSLTWESNGKDIYYQGESNKELPIQMKVTYKLDGKEISAKKLAGKSGHLEMTITYENLSKKTVQLNGKKETMYTPFTVATVFYINHKNASSIQGKNVKMVDDGTKTMFMGISFPGLQESLNVSKVNIPNEITVSMDVKKFEMGNMITVATPNLLDNVDASTWNGLNAIYSQVNSLNTASQTILNGTKTLNDGLITYQQKNQEFYEALSKINDGATLLNTKYQELDQGLRTIDGKTVELVDGAYQVNTGLRNALSNLNLPDIGTNKTELEKMYQGQLQLTNGLNQLKTSKESEGTYYNSLMALITANENLLKSLPADTDKTVIASLTAQIEQEKQIVSGLQQNQQTFVSSIQKMSETNTIFANGTAKTLQMINGLPDLNSMLEQMNQLAAGTEKVYQGTVALKSGMDTLVKGSSEMKQGIQTLEEGISALYQADSKLLSATTELQKGSKTLEDGMNQFHTTGISKINQYVNQDMKKLQKKVDKLLELSDEYQTYTQKLDTDKGTTKFIMISDSIKKSK